MAAFMIGKSLKDRRLMKAVEEIFDKADKNGNGKISIQDYIQIFTEHGVELVPDEIDRVSNLATNEGELTKEDFLNYAKNSEFLKSQMEKSENTIASRREAAAKAEMAFKVFDKDNDGFITKEEFQKISKKLSKDQIEAIFAKFDKDGDGVLSFEEFRKMLNKDPNTRKPK